MDFNASRSKQGIIFSWPCNRQWFLRKDTKEPNMKEKVRKLSLTFSSKYTTEKIKMQATDQEKKELTMLIITYT